MTSPVSPSETIAKAMEGVTHPDAPEWIAVAQDGDGPNGGFWTCAAATTESPRYIRADICAALARQAEALQRENDALRSMVVVASEALCPFAAAVFNDNGDMAVDLSPASADDYIRAYFADRRARALLGGENAGN